MEKKFLLVTYRVICEEDKRILEAEIAAKLDEINRYFNFKFEESQHKKIVPKKSFIVDDNYRSATPCIYSEDTDSSDCEFSFIVDDSDSEDESIEHERAFWRREKELHWRCPNFARCGHARSINKKLLNVGGLHPTCWWCSGIIKCPRCGIGWAKMNYKTQKNFPTCYPCSNPNFSK